MKPCVLFVFALLSFSSCSAPLGLLRQRAANEYASIPNKIGDDLVLKEKGLDEFIYFEEIKYNFEDRNHWIVLGNLMGGKSSLLLAINKKSRIISYKNLCAYCDSCRTETIKGDCFLIVNRHYRDMCAEQNTYSVYMIKEGVLECFDDFSRVCYFEGEPCSTESESYEQTFRLGTVDDCIAIFACKTEKNGSKHSSIHKLPASSR